MRAGLLLLFTLLGSSQAELDARAHFEKAERLYAIGRFDDALTEYQSAYDAKALPGFLFNIGQCYRNLGNLRQAVFSYKKYLDDKPDAKNRAAVRELIAELEQKIAAEDRRKPPPPKLDPPTPDPPKKDPAFVSRPPDPPPPPPPAPGFYKRWWFWTLAGAAAVGGGIAIYAASSGSGIPDTTFHNIDLK